MECSIGIRISSDDVAMLKRIAKSENRRFDDLMQLVFAEGLTYFFCETLVSVEKIPEDFTKDEQKQLALNKEIEAKNLPSWDAKKKAGYEHVTHYITNHETDRETNKKHDPLIEPIVQRIKDIALS